MVSDRVIHKSTGGESMGSEASKGVSKHSVVSHEEWLKARTSFLAKEKEFTHHFSVLVSGTRYTIAVMFG